jgi:FkbM family methyltransferase
MVDVWERLVTQYDLCSVLDIGCGEGNHTRWWHERGLYVLGVDGFPAYITHAVERNGLPAAQMTLHDFTKGPFVPDETFDLAWSSEFVEHVEAQFVPNFMASFRRARHVCLTFATPGQGGWHHVNEQLEAYWIERFAEAGFDLDRPETEAMRDTGRNTAYGRRTLTWFNARQPVVPIAREEGRYEYPLDRESVVLDVGGYHGAFAREIAVKHACRVHIFEPVPAFRDEIRRQVVPALSTVVFIHPFGLADSEHPMTFAVRNDSTGAYGQDGIRDEIQVELRDVAKVFSEFGFARVDLMKFNCEGGEFDILERMIACGLCVRVRFFQIQWHSCAPDATERRRRIKGALLRTHRTMWSSDWVWESFERKA